MRCNAAASSNLFSPRSGAFRSSATSSSTVYTARSNINTTVIFQSTLRSVTSALHVVVRRILLNPPLPLPYHTPYSAKCLSPGTVREVLSGLLTVSEQLRHITTSGKDIFCHAKRYSLAHYGYVNRAISPDKEDMWQDTCTICTSSTPAKTRQRRSCLCNEHPVAHL